MTKAKKSEGSGKANTKKASTAKTSRKAKPSPFKWPGVWATDEFTGQKYRLFLRRLPGKGTIPLKVIRDAVKKVRDERLARERAEAATDSPE